MSETRLIVRDARREICGTCHAAEADRLVAALSAEPETIDELEAAAERFSRSRGQGAFGGFGPRIVDEPHDAGLVIVDLAARLVAYESTYSSPGREGCVDYHDGRAATDVAIHYWLSDDWQFRNDILGWRELAEQRRRERAANPPLDSRAVLYGDRLLEFIARECFEANRRRAASRSNVAGTDEPDEADGEAVRDIHARWLLTSRDDLRGQAPRDVLLARKKLIGLDMQQRCNQWSRLHECPPGLDRNAHAFRFAGYGMHENVVYYDLVRELVWSCFGRAREALLSDAAAFLNESVFVSRELPRLAAERDEWLDAPEADFSGRTPREVIDRERARLPEGVSGHEAMVDHDCPLCQMMSDMPGPIFWHLDGCNMDDDFAFSFHPTREEYDEEQREWAEFHRRWEEREAERKVECERMGVTALERQYAGEDGRWRSSFVASEADGAPLPIRLFAIGSGLAELICDLREQPEGRPLIERLGRDFGNLRDVAQSDEAARGAALIEPVLQQLGETLAAVAAARDDLEWRCGDLQRRLERFLEPANAVEEAGGWYSDDEVPF